MKIRNRILIYFVTAVTFVAAVSLSVVLILFSEYREEEFQQRQKAKLILTINLLDQYKEKSENLSNTMDELSINDFFDEKMMIFDGRKMLIFSSIDDLAIDNYEGVLNKLSPDTQWLETKEGNYDLIGLFYEKPEESYYALSKAYDEYGYAKLDFLKNTLTLIFIGILLTIVLISYFLSKKLASPISQLSEDINQFNFESDEIHYLKQPYSGTKEIEQLYERFNSLLQRTNEYLAFQKHAVQHISHELKTPISVLVSELERLRDSQSDQDLSDRLSQLAYKGKFLGEIIQSLLQISKVESGQKLEKMSIRVDEMVFDLIEDMRLIYPEFLFDFQLVSEENEIEESQLEIVANPVLLKQAFQNLFSNCISYSQNSKARIELNCASDKQLILRISNLGNPLLEKEQHYLFENYFRGENSKGKLGFGLGLVLTKKIIEISGGSIEYLSTKDREVIFEIRFPLS